MLGRFAVLVYRSVRVLGNFESERTQTRSGYLHDQSGFAFASCPQIVQPGVQQLFTRE